MDRPVWLFSMDTEQFGAPPLTTGGLKASFLARGATAATTDVTLVHFSRSEAIAAWLDEVWDPRELERARRAIADGQTPVAGFSCYTWNVAEFLELIGRMRES